MPAPKGTGLKVEGECAKILKLAGVKDVWSKTQGQTGTKTNLVVACFESLKNLVKVKVGSNHYESLGVVDGKIAEKVEKDE